MTTSTEREADSPLVSIVTPTYNRADLLQWTIHSVRNQTYPRIEHVVVDGASTDSTAELLRAAEKTYPLVWNSEPDDGMYQAINKGLRLAKGEILAYLNSDDLYFPWTVAAVVQAFNEHPDVDFVFGDALAIDDRTAEVTIYWMLPFDLDFIRRSGFLTQPAVFWRRRAYEELGPLDETLRYVADCDYWMRAGERHRFLKVDEFLAIERLHPGTLREAVGGPLWDELRRVRSRYVDLDGPQHEALVARHEQRRRRIERRYKVRLLLRAYTPRLFRRGSGSRLLNSGLVRVRRFRYLLRVLLIGQIVPGLRSWTYRRLLRADRSILEPR